MRSSRAGMERGAVGALQAGLTILEVVLALGILGILGAVFTTSILSNLRHTTTAGQRTQAAQVLNYIGRRVAGGDSVVLPAAGETLTWEYGELSAAFADMSGAGFGNPNQYRVEITAAGVVTVVAAEVMRYDIDVCFTRQDGETCVEGTTLGAPATATAEQTPPLPGIN